MPRKNPKSIIVGRKPIPKRIVLFSIIRDESGSMENWRDKQGLFVPAIAERLRNAAGPNFIKTVFVQYTVISGGFVSSEIGPLDEITDPTYTPNGSTPLGNALTHATDKLQKFYEEVVIPQEITVRNFEILLISDCIPAGESIEDSKAGIERFIRFAGSHHAKVSIVVPDDAAKSNGLIQFLNISDRPTKTLADNPDDLLNVTFESLYQASRKIGNSNPAIRNGM